MWQDEVQILAIMVICGLFKKDTPDLLRTRALGVKEYGSPLESLDDVAIGNYPEANQKINSPPRPRKS